MVNYVVFNFVLCVCMLGVMGKVTYTLLWTMMCIKAYCHKGWLLEQLRVGEYSSAVNLQFCTPALSKNILLIVGCKFVSWHI